MKPLERVNSQFAVIFFSANVPIKKLKLKNTDDFPTLYNFKEQFYVKKMSCFLNQLQFPLFKFP